GAETGRRSEWDEDSMRFYDSSGAEKTRLSGDDSFFGGDASIGSLETKSATLGGRTYGPPGGEFALGTGTLDRPGSPLLHSSVPVARLPLAGSPGSAVFTDDAATYWWRL